MLHYDVAVSLASIWTGDSFGILRHQVKCLWQFSMCTEVVFSECQTAATWIWVAEVPIFFWPLLHSEQAVPLLQKNDVIPLLWKAYLLPLSLNLLSLTVLKSSPQYSLALWQWFLPRALYVHFDIESFSVTGYKKNTPNHYFREALCSWKSSATILYSSNPRLQDIIRSKPTTQLHRTGYFHFQRKYCNLQSRKSPVSFCKVPQIETHLWLRKEGKEDKLPTHCRNGTPALSGIEPLLSSRNYNKNLL